jgi:hypothetical protein
MIDYIELTSLFSKIFYKEIIYYVEDHSKVSIIKIRKKFFFQYFNTTAIPDIKIHFKISPDMLIMSRIDCN